MNLLENQLENNNRVSTEYVVIYIYINNYSFIVILCDKNSYEVEQLRKLKDVYCLLELSLKIS